MPNYKARGKKTLLDHHKATTTESSYTFTRSLDMKNIYRSIEILITGAASAALAMELVINAGTNFDHSNLIMDTSTLTGGLVVDATEIPILSAAILDDGEEFMIKLEIAYSGVTDKLILQSMATAPHEGLDFRSATAETVASIITSLKIQTSTSTWFAETEITIYGILR